VDLIGLLREQERKAEEAKVKATSTTVTDTTPVPDYGGLLRLDGRGFIVVGAGQGMGRQSAHALAQQGARVLCVDIDGDRAKAVAAEIDGVACVADMRVGDEAATVVATALREFGRLNGVANVVGMARYGPIVDMSEEDWDWCHDIVLRHAFHTVKHAGKAIAAGGGGSIVLVASISGISSAPYHAAYGAAKAGLVSLVRSAAMELKPSEVRVNGVAPGNTATPRIVTSQGRSAEELSTGSLSTHGATSDIASAILFLSSDLARHVTGQTLAVDGGDLVKFPHEMQAPPLPPGTAMGEAAVSR
jgi:NAD(P)-dependent dehydrogenase (short-subunit alcohol dehydrogenase family)